MSVARERLQGFQHFEDLGATQMCRQEINTLWRRFGAEISRPDNSNCKDMEMYTMKIERRNVNVVACHCVNYIALETLRLWTPITAS